MNYDTDNNKEGRWSGLLWVPTLYFAEALPNLAVVTLAVIMYMDMGLGNGQISMLTSLLYLPWVLKFLWSPFVDILRTKRWWILAMEIALGVMFCAVTLTLNTSWWLTGTLIFLWLMSFASATHDIAADGYYMLALTTRFQSAFVGVRTLFYRLASVFCQGGLVYLAGQIEDAGGDAVKAWMIVFGILAVIFFVLSLYHSFVLPRPRSDAERPYNQSGTEIWRGIVNSLVTFFRKPGLLPAIVFMLLYRLPEAQIVKLIPPFLLDSPDVGGLGLSVSDVGMVYGTFGVAGLIAGGIIGGIVASIFGLRKVMMPMAVSMSLTCATFLYLSVVPSHPLWMVMACVVIEQFGYGFGFTAYMLYLLYYSEGEYKTTHYAICTAFMALSILIPGLWAGYLQEAMGYAGFFVWTMGCCVATIAVAAIVKVNPEFGKK